MPLARLFLQEGSTPLASLTAESLIEVPREGKNRTA